MAFAAEIRDCKAREAITGKIARIDSHTRERVAVHVEGYIGIERPIYKGSIVLVHQQQVRRCIAGYEQVLPAVTIYVNRHYPQCAPGRLREAGLGSDIGKGSVTVIVIKRRCISLVGFLRTVGRGAFVAAGQRQVVGELHIVADKKVE